MLLIVGTVRFPPDRIAEARPAMERMIMASRQEQGCIAYSYAEDVLDPGIIHVNEAWRDDVCFAAHATSAHLATWRAVCTDLGAYGRDLSLYEAGPARPI
jgi:quinol monooxygenase YgiN